MKKLTYTLALVMLALVPAVTLAAESGAGVALGSAYVWRGMTVNEGLVLQPYVETSAKGFTANIWGNLDIDDADGAFSSGDFSEIDITLSYATDMKCVSVSVGLIEYLFPGLATPGTTELFVTAGGDLPAGFSADAGLYVDVDELETVYATLSASYELEAAEGLTVGASALLGFMFNADEDGAHEYNVTLDAAYAALEAMELGCYVSVVGSLDEDVLPDQEVDLNGGISVGCSF